MVRKLLLLTCTIAVAATVGAASWSGAGTAANPYLVTSVADLEAINAGLTATNSYYGKYFKQTVDIDVTADSSTFAGIGQGNNTKIQFAGTYDGNGKAIHNLKIDGVVYDESGKAVLKTSNSVAGLFGFISANGTVKNLTIASDCSFKAFRIVGAVAGKSYGRIENCYNYAPVTAISNAAGGIVGQSADTTSRVLNCYNAGRIVVGYYTVGGIASTCEGVLSYCQNDGEVAAEYVNSYKAFGSQYGAGGIVGTEGQYSTIAYNVNTGNVSAVYVAGGITSSTPMYGSTLTGNINYGAVSYLSAGSNSIGAIIGSECNRDCILSYNYFDKQIGYYDGVGTASHVGVIGLNTARITDGKPLEGLDSVKYDWKAGQYPVLAQFKDEVAGKAHRAMVVTLADSEDIQTFRTSATLATSATWALKKSDFFAISGSTLSKQAGQSALTQVDTLVATVDGYTKALPLRSLNISGQFEGEGTEASPYLIKTAADMATLATLTNSNQITFEGNYFKVANDIDFTGVNYAPVAVDGGNFKGVFDGDGKYFHNVNFTIDGQSGYRALFGNVGGVVRNLVLASGSLSSYRGTAGIAGKVYGTIENCDNYATVSNTKSTGNGGIAGMVWSGGKVVNCRNHADLTVSRTNLGGIAYYVNQGGLLENCANYGHINATAGTSAAIVATNEGTVRGCINYGDVDGTSTIAGVVSMLDGNGVVENCVNFGNITADSLKLATSIAGIVGSSLYTEGTTSVVRNCANYGEVKANGNVGGILGKVQPGVEISGCANYGTIYVYKTTTGSMAGGIAGNIETRVSTSNNIHDCTNAGTVSAPFASVGGIVGSLNTTLSSCYNIADVSGSSNVGGIAGTASSTAQIQGVYSVGLITAADSATVGNVAGSCAGTIAAAYYDNMKGKACAADGEAVIGKTTRELCTLVPSDGYANVTGSYPTLKALSDSAAANYFAATVVLAEGETDAAVKSPFTIGTPEGTTWTCSENLTIDGNNVKLGADGVATLHKAFSNGPIELEDDYMLVISAESGVAGVNAEKTVSSVACYDLQGRRVDSAAGMVIKVIRYTDGTTSVVKAFAK